MSVEPLRPSLSLAMKIFQVWVGRGEGSRAAPGVNSATRLSSRIWSTFFCSGVRTFFLLATGFFLGAAFFFFLGAAFLGAAFFAAGFFAATALPLAAGFLAGAFFAATGFFAVAVTCLLAVLDRKTTREKAPGRRTLTVRSGRAVARAIDSHMASMGEFKWGWLVVSLRPPWAMWAMWSSLWRWC